MFEYNLYKSGYPMKVKYPNSLTHAIHTKWKGVSQYFIKRRVTRHHWLLEYLEDQTDRICSKILRKDGHMLKYIRNPTWKMYRIAINRNKRVIGTIHDEDFLIDYF